MIVDPDFPNHWKTKLLVRQAGDEIAVRCLLRFWGHCQQRQRWIFDKLSAEMLASICEWPGEPEVFIKAMTESGYLEKKGARFVAHDWDQINATLIGRWRGGKATQSRWKAKAKPIAKPMDSPASANTEPVLSLGSARARREEKSRIEKNPPTVPQGGQASNPESAKLLICKHIFPGKDPGRPWSNEAMHNLASNLPIPMHEILIIGRAHRVAKEQDPEGKHFRPRQSEIGLCEHWSDEVTRSESFLKKIGAGSNGAVLAKKEPARWREFFQWKYRETGPVRLPERFDQLPADQRKEWEADHEAWEKAEGAA